MGLNKYVRTHVPGNSVTLLTRKSLGAVFVDGHMLNINGETPTGEYKMLELG